MGKNWKKNEQRQISEGQIIARNSITMSDSFRQSPKFSQNINQNHETNIECHLMTRPFKSN